MHRRNPSATCAGKAVVLPGTGSDARFVEDAFGRASAGVGLDVVAVVPDPYDLVASYEAALDDAARRHGRIVAGGVSIGAAVAVRWALRNPDRVAGLLLALPAWTGPAAGSPAAASAAFTAAELRRVGLAEVTASMTRSTPAWLATTLTRSWASQWPGLPSALDEAAQYTGPSLTELRAVTAPTAIVGAVDDPIHPWAIAKNWAATMPRARVTSVELADIGLDPGVLGDRCVDELSQLCQLPSC